MSSSASTTIPALTAGKILPLARQMSSAAAGSSGQTGGQAVKVERITVFGAGLMGAGIAQVGAQNGFKVCILFQGVVQSRSSGLGEEELTCYLGRIVRCDRQGITVSPSHDHSGFDPLSQELIS